MTESRRVYKNYLYELLLREPLARRRPLPFITRRRALGCLF
jgi:hypothetical protein